MLDSGSTWGLTPKEIAELQKDEVLLYKEGKIGGKRFFRAKVSVEAKGPSPVGCQVKIIEIQAHDGQDEAINGEVFFAAYSMLKKIKS